MTISAGKLLLIFFIALVVPLIVQTFKRIKYMMFQKWHWRKVPALMQPILDAVIWAVILCFAARAGIFEAFGFALLCKWLDYLVTGLIVSQGVDKLYGLITGMKEYRNKIVADELAEKKGE